MEVKIVSKIGDYCIEEKMKGRKRIWKKQCILPRMNGKNAGTL